MQFPLLAAAINAAGGLGSGAAQANQTGAGYLTSGINDLAGRLGPLSQYVGNYFNPTPAATGNRMTWGHA